MKRTNWIATLLLCSAGLLSADTLVKRFENPSAESQPITWWHWMNGNVTKEGITRDLEWMARVGIGGVVVFETSHASIPGRAVHRSEYWQECVTHAIEECARLGLTFGMHNCSGWNNSGGPWVDPEDSMKKLVFSRALLSGPANNPAAPPAPPAERIFPFSGQNHLNRRLESFGQERTEYDPYYEDVAVYAYPAPEGATPPMRELEPELQPATVGNPGVLWDGDHTTGVNLNEFRSADGKHGELVFRFDQPLTVRSLSLVTGAGGIRCRNVELAVANGDSSFDPVKTFEIPQNGGPLREFQGVSFDAVTADRFRLRFTDLSNRGPTSSELREVEFSGDARIETWPVKAGFLSGRGEQVDANPAVAHDPAQAVSVETVLDLTGRLRPDGTLDWETPPGRWMILRMGMTSNGKTNHPAAVGGLGLEVDKFDRAALDRFFKNGPMQLVVDLAGKHAGTTFKTFGTDSWEVGAQNWTPGMTGLFEARRGYDPTPYLPALTGQIVESVAVTERFLWDWRQTCSDLFAEHFYGGFQAFCHQHGLHSFAEPYNNGNYNNLQMGGYVDDVAPVFWTDGRRFSKAGTKAMVSLANTYGLGRVEAEAYTSASAEAHWRFHPRKGKALGDRAFAYGINRFVFHTSAHQPWADTVPGMTMGPYGINLTRNITWADQSKAWLGYINRCQSVLQAGRYAADLLVFIGEDSPNNGFIRSTKIPQGYEYDASDAVILLEHASVEEGEIVLKSGMRYRLLVLSDETTMTVPLAEKIRELVRDGATVLAPRKPLTTPGLEGYPASDEKFAGIIAELFGNLDGKRVKDRAFGDGRLLAGMTVGEALALLDIDPSWTVSSPPESGEVNVLSRVKDGEPFFFVACDNKEPVEFEVSFRVQSGQPEIWNPYHHTRRLAAGVRHENGRTIVPLRFEPDDAVFVVFPETPTTTSEATLNFTAERIAPLSGPWTVYFQPERGAPESVALSKLIDLSTHSEEGIKYFSGTATYSTDFNLQSEIINRPSAMLLDLGRVEVIAEVILNGRNLGVLWKEPYRVDISDAAVSGENELEVRVTNLWPNRLIGDERQFPQENAYWWAASGEWPDWVVDPDKPNPTGRIGFVTWPYWKADDELLPSGLIGPVELIEQPAR